MTRTPKLNDLQLVLLATAARREDGSLLPPPEQLGDQSARIRKVVPPLIKRALVAEVEVSDASQAWRSDGNRHIGALITDAGRAVIGADQSDPEDPIEAVASGDPRASETGATAVPKPASKIGRMVALLERDGGATLDEIVAITGWLPHTTRAALTGLRKKGRALTKAKRGEITCYHLAKAA